VSRRRKRLHMKRSRTLYLLPPIRDDMPIELKNALALRNQCSTSGRCPSCGVTPTFAVDSHGFAHLIFEHEAGCRALTDEAAADWGLA
jgi:hypothetical protein